VLTWTAWYGSSLTCSLRQAWNKNVKRFANEALRLRLMGAKEGKVDLDDDLGWGFVAFEEARDQNVG
jgi:hypothetical protein